MVTMEYAIDIRSGSKKHIDEVPKNKNNGQYHCLCCQQVVIVRKGEVRNAHFAHTPSEKSEKELQNLYREKLLHYDETDLHKKAKIYFSNLKQLKIPAQKISMNSKKDFNGEKFSCYSDEISEIILEVIDTNKELKIGDVIPDVILKVKPIDQPNADALDIFIEVFVSHKVNDLKKRKLQNNELNCIEINLSSFDREKINDAIYFHKEMNDFNNYKYINIANNYLKKKESEIIEEYESNLSKANSKIIKQREKFIKYAYDSAGKIIYYKYAGKFLTYTCMCCGEEMGYNKNNFYHKEISICKIFEKKKDAGVKYNKFILALIICKEIDMESLKEYIPILNNELIFIESNGYDLSDDENFTLSLIIVDFDIKIKMHILFDDHHNRYPIRKSYIMIKNWSKLSQIDFNEFLIPDNLDFYLTPITEYEIEKIHNQ